jgi:hypothetical protein
MALDLTLTGANPDTGEVENLFCREVREAVGRVSKEEYSDPLLSAQVDRALTEFSRRCPRLHQCSLTLVDGKQIYSFADFVPAPSTSVYGILTDSLTSPAGGGFASFASAAGWGGSVLPGMNDPFRRGTSPISQATDLFLDRLEAEIYRRDSENCLEIQGDQVIAIIGSGSLYGVVKAWLLVGQVKTAFPERYKEELLLCVKYMVAGELIQLRAKFKNFKAGASSFGLSLSELQSLMKDSKDSFENRVRTLALSATY